MNRVNGTNTITTAQAIEYLATEVDRIRKAPMMQKPALAECALSSALAILRAFEVRVTRLEAQQLNPLAAAMLSERIVTLEARAAKLEKDFEK